MSQKVIIERVSVRGATPFLGLADNDDPTSTKIYSRCGDDVMDWLCAAWRTRYNAYRSRRSKYGANKELLPLGSWVDNRTEKEARASQSWLAAVPTLLLESPQQVENSHWFASVARRQTLRKQGKNPGKMPRFRSKTRDDDIFTVWFNGGRNATFQQVNKNHGIIFITGQNPKDYRRPGEGQRFAIRLHVRVSEPIRPYTSIQVNWTAKTLVFTNKPRAITRTGDDVTGIDLGVANAIATDDGRLLRLPLDKLTAIDKEIRRRQKAQARAVKESPHPTAREYRKAGVSRRFADHDAQIARLNRKATNIVRDCHEKWSLDLARTSSVIYAEDLHLADMSTRSRAIPDPLRPGAYLPNGQSAKRGLNRVLRGARLGQLTTLLEDKASRAGGAFIKVDPRNTSRYCHHCGHVSPDNRKSQAVFECVRCGHRAHADTHAAINIKLRGLRDYPWGGQSHAEQSGQTQGEGTADPVLA